MKIVLLCISALGKGGAEKILLTLSSALQKTGSSYRPVVISAYGGTYEEKLRASGIRTQVLIRQWWNPVQWLIGTGQYALLLLQNRKTVVGAVGFLPLGAWIGLFAKAFGVPVIYSMHSSTSYFGIRKNVLRWVLHHSALMFVDAVTCVSPAITEKLNRRNAITVLNGIDFPDESTYHDARIENEYFSSHESFYVVSIYNVRPPRDTMALLGAAEAMPDIRFVHVGGGKDLDKFRKIANGMNLTNIRFAGSQDNVFPFLSSAGAFLLLTDNEGFPTAVIEAMAAHVPVVINRIEEVEGILIDGENCLMAEKQDIDSVRAAIYSLRDDEKRRTALAGRGRETAERMFSSGTMVRAYCDEIERIACEKGARASAAPDRNDS